MTRFALSSAWHGPDVRDAAEVLAVAAGLGFDAVELSSVNAAVVEGVRALDRDGAPPIVSLHAPCPVPYPGAERLDDLASASAQLRTAAVDYTRRTIGVAADVGARAVVVHLGEVPAEVSQRSVVKAMEAGDEGWRDLLARGLAQRQTARDRHFQLCLESLQALTAHAAGSGVRLAAETRYHYNDIPDFEEFASILEMFASRGVGYWHDVGHAHTQQTLGLATAQAYLSRYRSHLLGFHLHDAKGTRDHWPPGEGEIDFGALRAYAHADHLYVCEVASRHPANHLAASLEFLRDLGLGS